MSTPRIGVSSSCVPGESSSGSRKVMPSSPPVRSDSCDARMAKNDAIASVIIAKKIVRTRKREQPDRQRQHERQRQRAGGTEPPCCPSSARAGHGERDAVAADAEEHGVGERDDAGIAEQQVVRCDQQDEHADLGGDVERPRAREKEGRQREAEQDGEQAQAEQRGCAVRRRTAGAGARPAVIIAWPPDRVRPAATAAPASSAGWSSRARPSARGSRRSCWSAPPAARRRSSRRPSRARR